MLNCHTSFCLPFSALTIGLSQTEYTVMEGTPFVEVCAEVMNGVVERETIVSLDTADNTAEGSYTSDLSVHISVMYHAWTSPF